MTTAVLLGFVIGDHLIPNDRMVPIAGTRDTPSAGTSFVTTRPQSPSVAASSYVGYSEAGWIIELPSGWTRRLKSGDSSGSVFWYAPDGVSYLQVDPQSWGSGGARVQAQKADSVASRNASRFPGYQLIGITDVSYQDDAADWDFTFNDATGAGPVHGRDRFFQSSGRPFEIYLRALDTYWPDYQEALAHAYASFRLL